MPTQPPIDRFDLRHAATDRATFAVGPYNAVSRLLLPIGFGR